MMLRAMAWIVGSIAEPSSDAAAIMDSDRCLQERSGCSSRARLCSKNALTSAAPVVRRLEYLFMWLTICLNGEVSAYVRIGPETRNCLPWPCTCQPDWARGAWLASKKRPDAAGRTGEALGTGGSEPQA